MTKVLNVIYQSDDFYILASAASITSLLMNNQHFDQINIYYLGYELSDDSITKLNHLTNQYQNATLFFVDTKIKGYNDIFVNLPGARAWNDRYITWFKLLAFGEFDFSTDRVLYLNPHTIVTGVLDDLLEIDFQNNIFALSYDCLIESHKKQIGLDYQYGYYNCGVMLVNVEKWQKENLTAFCLDNLKEDHHYVIVDQDFCNIVFKGQIKLLGPEYNYSSAYYAYHLKRLLKDNHLTSENYYSYAELMAERFEPKIIHSSFGLTGKPWETGNEHPNGYLWDKYIKLSPWKNVERPVAKKSLGWQLYKILPNWLFMSLYHKMIKRNFGA